MNKLVKHIVLFIVVITLSVSCKNADQIRKRAEANKPKVIVKAIKPNNLGAIKKVAVADFENAIKTATLIDVRTPEEFAEEHLKGAVNINFKKRTFPDYINAIAKDKPVAIYCRSANRTGKAALIMQSLGFKTIYDLDGGTKAWKAANKEFIKGDTDANKKLQATIKKESFVGKNIVGKSHQIGVEEFDKLVRSDKVTLVDTRTAKEFAQGHIEGAINVDWRNRHFVIDALKNITNDKPVAIYCRSGNRSTRAMHAMAALGFTEVYNLEKGIKSWNAAKMPLKTLEVKGDIRHLDVANFNNAILGKVGVLLDIRTPREYDAFHLAGAKMIDYNKKTFKTEIEKLDKKVPLLIYCRTGGRTGRAVKKLEKMGYKVYNLDKGIKKWREEGMHVEGKDVNAVSNGEEGC